MSEEESKGEERVEGVWGEKEGNVRDVKKGMGWSKGGQQVQAAMTATVAPQRHRRRCLSHTRRRSLTTHLTTERHFSKRHPTTPSGTRDQQAVLHTPFGAHRLRRGAVEDATTCLRPHPLPTSPDSHPQQKHHPNPHPSLHPRINNPT